MMDNRGGIFSNLPPVTKNIIIINLLLWLATFLFRSTFGVWAMKYGALHYWGAPDFNAAQLFTYMFLHDNQGFAHVLFNMFSVFIFGRILEQVWGGKRFLFYYISTGLGAGLIQELVWSLTISGTFALTDSTTGAVAMQGAEAMNYALAHGMNVGAYYNQFITVGASGAVFGILLAFGMMFPNAPMFIWFIPIPIKAKYLVIGYGVIELLFGIGGIQQGVAHFAHLGGMLFGFIILMVWKKRGILGGGFF